MSNFMQHQTFRAVVWRRTRRSLTFCAVQPAIAACCSGLEPSAARPVKLIKSGAGTSAAQRRGSARELPLESTATLRHQIVRIARIRIFPLNENSNETDHFLWNHTHVVLTPDFMLHSTNSSQRVCLPPQSKSVELLGCVVPDPWNRHPRLQLRDLRHSPAASSKQSAIGVTRQSLTDLRIWILVMVSRLGRDVPSRRFITRHRQLPSSADFPFKFRSSIGDFSYRQVAPGERDSSTESAILMP